MADQPKRILAIHAHPDDVEFQCAGTLLLLKERGCSVVIATMTPGDCGSAEMGAEEIARVRRDEARKAAAILGAECHCLEFRDLQIVHDNPSRKRVTEFLRRVQPDLVFTAPPVDYMSDHEMTSRLVRDACFNASVPNYDTEANSPAPPLAKIPHLYYMDPVMGVDGFGDPLPMGGLIDVTPVFETKRAMLACHESQRNWLTRQHGVDEYLDMQARWSRRRGWEINVEYAEAFRQHRGHPYPQDDLLRSLLGTPPDVE
jgi:LmbE family N-acetylglucosaminyl deacetylase